MAFPRSTPAYFITWTESAVSPWYPTTWVDMPLPLAYTGTSAPSSGSVGRRSSRNLIASRR